MRHNHNKHGLSRTRTRPRTRTRLYGLLSVPLLVLLLARSQVLAQSTEAATATSEQNRDDLVQVNWDSTEYTISFSIGDVDKDKYTIENITCRTGSGPTIVANAEHVCESLDPCSIYTSVITLQATDATVITPDITQTISAETKYKEPQTQLKSVNATEKTIQLGWETSDQTCVKSYEISAIAPDSTLSRQQLKDGTTYTFLDVLPCRTYNVTLETRNIDDVAVDRDTQLVDTLYLEPGDLTLTISNRANGDTRISWSDPDNKSCVGNFTFIWRRNDCKTNPDDDETTTATTETATTETTETVETNAPEEVEPADPRQDCQWRDNINDTTLKQVTLTDLQGCALHTIEVYINMKLNATPKASETFVSAVKVPSAISDPIRNITPTELRFQWSPPDNHPECVANYWVNLTGPTQRAESGSLELSSKETFVLFENLQPCGIYNVEILPILNNGTRGGKFESQSQLSEDQPSQIREPQSILGAFSIELSWQTPLYADLCIGGYRLAGWMDDNKPVPPLSATTPNNTVLFNKDLIACQVYTIQIIPYTRDKDLDGELLRIEVETQAAAVNTDKILLQLVGDGAGSHSLELNAYNQDFVNNCRTIFAHMYCSTSATVPNKYAEKYVESYREGRGFQAIIAPLSPFTSYKCSVLLYNVAGPSSEKSLINLQTEAYFPDQPMNVTLDISTKNSLTFSWQPPKFLNGPIKYYQAFLMRYEADYFVPSKCPSITELPKTDTKGDVISNFSELAPGVKYMMQVAAQNDFGLGQYTAPIIGITEPDVSDPVTDLNVTSQGPEPDRNTYSANVTVRWNFPCKSHGEVEYFLLEFADKRAKPEKPEEPEEPEKPEKPLLRREVPPETHDKSGRMSYTETELLPEFNYQVKVSVKTRNVATPSESIEMDWQSPAGLPSNLGDDVLRQMRVSAYETNHPTKSAIVRLPANILNSGSGNITFIALLLSQKGCAGEPQLKYDVLVRGEWPSVASWDQVGGDCIYQYQTTPERWNPYENRRSVRDNHEDEIIFTIGTDKCPEQTKRYCNGPLNANTEYNMVVRLFTSAGYNDAALLEFKTDAAIKVTLILVSVCSCLLLAFVLGLGVLWVRKRIAWYRDSGQGIEDSFGNVIAKNFAIFYAEVSKPEKLTREFKEITVVALELSYAASELGSNKNRYADIYPYDKNRVILDIDTEGSDYINASFIDGFTHKKEYIATQGPKPESVMDFWRMILQHNVRVIVQVTQFREGNTIKCHEYFPYNMRGLSVTIKSKESFEVYDRTELSVVHEKYGLKQKVLHFFFKKWPDHGCPDDPTHLITFVKKVKAERRPNYSPIVVHCSAGVGRTGTFIALDLIMQRLKSESKINIFETVKKLRFQRMKMVQTQQQYTFLYACTYELVKHKIPRAALKLEGRPKSSTPPSLSTVKKVCFPGLDPDHAEPAVQDTPDPESGAGFNMPTNLQLATSSGGLRRAKDLDSLYEQPERNSSKWPLNGKNGECAI